LAVQTVTLLLMPKVDKRIDDVQYANYNIPTLKYGHRVLVEKERSVEHGKAYVYTEEDYEDGRVEETYAVPVVTLRTIDDAKQVLRLMKLNALLQQLVSDKTATTAQIKSALTLEQYNEYVSSLTTVKHFSEIKYGGGMPRDLRKYNQLLNAADFQLAKYEKMNGLQSSGKAKYKHDTLKSTYNKSEDMYEHALENLEELWSVVTLAERYELQQWMDRDVDFDKGFDRTVSCDADSMPRVRGSKSPRALDSGLPKLSKRLKRKECQLLALRGAAWGLAFEGVAEDNAQSEAVTARLKERIANWKARKNLFEERD
jgi:hypothetical protein